MLGVTLPGFSQHSDSPEKVSQSAPAKIGLALSGGGAKGFAHIGVLKVFEEENIPVHMITGTSMGAVIGSLYSIGYTPDQITEVALRTDWIKLFDDNYQFNPRDFSNSVSGKDTYLFNFPFYKNNLQLPMALTDGQNVSMMLYRLMLPFHDIRDFSRLPVPFACVGTDLATGEARLFTEGYLPDAVRASFAIPSFFKPVTIGDQTYIDGGVARNLPVEDALSIGADVVIASDVGEPVKPVDSLKTFLHILRQSVGFRQQESDRRQKEKADFYIQPDISHYSSFSYDEVNDLIQRGEEAAREVLPEIKQYLNNSPVAAPGERYRLPGVSNDTLLISDIRFNNIEGRLVNRVHLTLDLLTPTRTTISDIEQKVKQLYSSGLFSQVSYRLTDSPGQEGKVLTMTFQPGEQENAGFSMRYDSQYKAALLLGISLNNNLIWGDRLTARVRAGEVLSVSAHYFTPLTLTPLSRFHLGFGVQRSPIDYYIDGDALSSIGVEQLVLRPSFSLRFPNELQIQTGLDMEFYNLNEAVGNTLVLENTHFLLKGFGELNYSTLNRPYFPTLGQKADLRATVSSKVWGSSEEFFQLSGSWLSTIRLSSRLNFTNHFLAGYTSAPSSLPLHYNFYLGGLTRNPVFSWHQFPFVGYESQQLHNSNIMALQSTLQLRLTKNVYALGRWNIAHLSDHWTFGINSDRLWQGFSLSAGATTMLGPVEVALTTPDFQGGYTVKINLGYRF